MPIKAQDLYNQVCIEICEPNGVQLGIVSQEDIINYINQTVREWIYASGLYKQLFIIPIIAGVSVYNQPSFSVGASQAWFNEETIFESSGFIWDQTDDTWRLEGDGNPSEWREDNVGVLKLQLRPTPISTGTKVTTSLAGWYGTWSSSTVPVVEFSCESTSGLYGTISTCGGDAFVDCPGGMFGIPSAVYVSTGNLLVATLNDQYYTITDLTQYIDVVPNSFEFYILAGVLARIYASDGEMKNPEMAKYWQTRYKEGINMARAIAGEVSLEGNK